MTVKLDRPDRLSPFELRNILIGLASSHAERIMLNAGRGNPNFLATAARHGFFELGRFAMEQAELSDNTLPEGVAGMPRASGIAGRLRDFIETRPTEPGSRFLASVLDFACNKLGVVSDSFVHELTQGVLGCNYPEPVRMLQHAEDIVSRYLVREMGGPEPSTKFDLYAVEGATAGITYVFNSLRANKLIAPGDSIAIGTPIFAPYLEIPALHEYRLREVAIAADPNAGWQYPENELAKLRAPEVKVLLLVNPGNPTSVAINQAGLSRITQIIHTQRPDLIVLTDDVYATFADNFTSLFALCPYNTILIYSFSKYFGATGWRLGVIAMAQDNIVDAMMRTQPEADYEELRTRYASLVPGPCALKFIDRLVADSRAIALNHTAGLSTPQQVQMMLFASSALMDAGSKYKTALKQLIRDRYQALCRGLRIGTKPGPDEVCYYALLDLERMALERSGQGFVDWLLTNKNPLEFLTRLADEAGVVLLPGNGFGAPHPSARVSLANLDEADYARIGDIIQRLIEEYFAEYLAAQSASVTALTVTP